MQTRLHWRLTAALLGTIGLALAACTPAPIDTPQALPSQSPRKTPLVTATQVAKGFRSQLITADQPLGARWTRDGQTIIYAKADKQSGGKSQYSWYAFNIVTREQSGAEPPVTIAPQIWKQLEAIPPVPEDNLWFQGAVSPSRTRVIYSRTQPGYTPQAGKRNFPPLEIWIARVDGSEARKLGGPVPCGSLFPIIWFAQERKALISCSYEGPPQIYVANTENYSIAELGRVTAFQGTTDFGMFSLSPDETRLAITDLTHTLQIVPLDGSQVQPMAQWGYEPRWSPDSRRLYYKKGQDLANCHSDSIHVYDLATGTDKVVIESPFATSEGNKLNIACGGPFEISPRENAAVIWSSGLWLIEWPR